MKKSHFALFILLVFSLCTFWLLCTHKGNSKYSDTSSNPSTETQYEDPSNLTRDTMPDVTEITAYEESIVDTEHQKICIQNTTTIANAHGKHFDCIVNCQNGQRITINAAVDIGEIENMNQYEYKISPFTDIMRENLLQEYWGPRYTDAEYDERNNMWILRNSDKVGDYYRYETSFGWDGLPEDMFFTEYRNVNLDPSQSNLLSSVDDVTLNITLGDAFSYCENIIDAISDSDCYKADYILPFGNQGRTQYYWIVYKRLLNGAPITAYGDLKFLVDSNGIQHISGAIYDIGAEMEAVPLISVDEAIESLKMYAPLVSFEDGVSDITISKITLEYVVVNDQGNPVITPVWRFQIGSNENERNLMRERILAIDAITGDLIQDRRRHTF